MPDHARRLTHCYRRRRRGEPLEPLGYRASCTCGWHGPVRRGQGDACRDFAAHTEAKAAGFLETDTLTLEGR